MAASQPFPFLSLPLELRESIYSLYFKPADRLVRSDELDKHGFFGGVYEFDFRLYRTNRQIWNEAAAVWKRENVFVKIATPWPSAGMYRVYLMSEDGDEDREINHISSEGLVPIVCTDPHSTSFTTHHAVVEITAPFHQATPEHTVVVLLDDLHLFTQTWHYSALSYPMLNDRLATSFALVAPANADLQRRILLPFTAIKGLHDTHVTGFAPDVRAALAKGMAVPLPSVTACCDAAAAHMAAGDLAMAARNPQDALDLYIQAFHAIHILILGRTRRVLADVFFHAPIVSGQFAGQTGMSARVLLRLQLVSRCVLAYIHLQLPAEAAFWGLRTMRIMRDSLDASFEDFLANFAGGADVGMIYVRTGVALWMLEQAGEKEELEACVWDGFESRDGVHMAKSERVWRVARGYVRGATRAQMRAELRRFGVAEEVMRWFADREDGARAEV